MRALFIQIGLLLTCLCVPPAPSLPSGDAQPTISAPDLEQAANDLTGLTEPVVPVVAAPAFSSSLPHLFARLAPHSQLWLEHLRLLC
jgi:hypothetical protein